MKSTTIKLLQVFTNDEIDEINKNSALTDAEINTVSGGVMDSGNGCGCTGCHPPNSSGHWY